MTKQLMDAPLHIRVNSGVLAYAREKARSAGMTFPDLVRACLQAIVDGRAIMLAELTGNTGANAARTESGILSLSPEAFAEIYRQARELGLISSA